MILVKFKYRLYHTADAAGIIGMAMKPPQHSTSKGRKEATPAPPFPDSPRCTTPITYGASSPAKSASARQSTREPTRRPTRQARPPRGAHASPRRKSHARARSRPGGGVSSNAVRRRLGARWRPSTRATLSSASTTPCGTYRRFTSPRSSGSIPTDL